MKKPGPVLDWNALEVSTTAKLVVEHITCKWRKVIKTLFWGKHFKQFYYIRADAKHADFLSMV